jgi:hypothetical protein
MLITSVAAIIAPAFEVNMPEGTFGVMCIANAPSGFGCRSMSPSSIILTAPK